MAITSLRQEEPVLSRLSNEPVWAPVRVDSLTTTDTDLTTASVKMAFTKEDPVAADWLTATVEGTWVGPDGETYYVLRYATVAGAFPAGTYDHWAQVAIGGLTYVHRLGTIRFY